MITTDVINSYSKINVHLGVIKKKNSNLHSIESLVIFTNLSDKIIIKEIKEKKNKIFFYGKYSKNISVNNTVSKLLNLLEKQKILKNKKYLIKIKKDIPTKSGMGGGSMNAASILNFFNKKNKLRLTKKKIFSLCSKIGSDVQFGLDNNSKIMLPNGAIRKTKKFKAYLVIVMPKFGCSTKQIYTSVKKYSKSILKINKNYGIINSQNLKNDLEQPAFKLYPKLENIKKNLEKLPNISFARMTGSGAAMVGYFSKRKDALHGKKLIKKKYKNYWCITSKTI